MTRVNIGGLYEEFDTIEDVIHYLRFEKDERYRAIAEAMSEMLKQHDNDLKGKFYEAHQKEIDERDEEIARLEGLNREAYDALERFNDELDYEDGDTIEIYYVKNQIQKIEAELL